MFHIGGYTGRGCFIYWRLYNIRGSRHAIELAAVSQQRLVAFISSYDIPGGGLTLWAALGLWLPVCGVLRLCQVSARVEAHLVVAAAQLLQCVNAGLARNQIHGRVERKCFSTHAAVLVKVQGCNTHVNTTVFTFTPLKLMLSTCGLQSCSQRPSRFKC